MKRSRGISGSEPVSRNPAVNLITKLIAVLEHVESMPVITNDQPGSQSNLQTLTKRIRIKFKLASQEK